MNKDEKALLKVYSKEGLNFYQQKRKDSFFNEFLVNPAFRAKAINLGALNKKTLDVGCGFGADLKYYIKKKAKNLFGIDISQACIDVAGDNIKSNINNVCLRKCSVNQIDFKYEFDLILANLIFDQIKNLDKAFKKIAEALKENGVFLFSISHPVSTATFDYKKHLDDYFKNDIVYFNPKTHNRKLFVYKRSLSDLSKILRQTGFFIVEIIEPKPIKKAFSRHLSKAKKYSRLPGVLFIHAKKMQIDDNERYYKYYLKHKKNISGAPINEISITESELAKKLVVLAKNVLYSKKYFGEFSYVAKKFKFTFDDIIHKVLFYTLDLNKVENSDYENCVMRACLRLHFLVEGSYHRKKAEIVLKYMKNPEIKSAIEFGCGFPGDYVFDAVERKSVRVTLSDVDSSSIDYSRAVLEFYYKSYDKQIDFKIVDINKMKYPGDYGAYIFLDSLEHALNPEKYLRFLVSNAPKGAHFIFSLPIGKIDSMEHAHHVEFITKKEITQWIENAGLKILNTTIIIPNTKVDYFAEFVVGGYTDILIDSVKK